ncbi:hypothetical protein BpHYR1_024947 [Brachionus plicatilis]|uniref:Transmembrane protein n=1 Tax=Brachionus plicatilis TaxID=10195 RepID=A0A3M7PF73_BRAPC|nr:hypothetical protein BpHYR1_024947 [Brachionus plicatilis]
MSLDFKDNCKYRLVLNRAKIRFEMFLLILPSYCKMQIKKSFSFICAELMLLQNIKKFKINYVFVKEYQNYLEKNLTSQLISLPLSGLCQHLMLILQIRLFLEHYRKKYAITQTSQILRIFKSKAKKFIASTFLFAFLFLFQTLVCGCCCLCVNKCWYFFGVDKIVRPELGPKAKLSNLVQQEHLANICH